MGEGMAIQMREEERGGVLLVTPLGRLDSNTSEDFGDKLFARLDGGVRRLAIDMSGLDYVSSAGLRAFLLTAKKLQDMGGRMALGGMNPSVKQVFTLAGLLSIFTVEPDAAGAVARLTDEPRP